MHSPLVVGPFTAVHEPRFQHSLGRTLARMARIAGRTDDLILFHGVGFTPAQIAEILKEVTGAIPHYQIVLDREGHADTLEVKIDVSESIPSLDEVKKLESLRSQIAKHIRTALDIEAKIAFVEPRSLRQVADGKDRVLDRRPG